MKEINVDDIGTRCSPGPASLWKTSPLTHPFQESPKNSLLFAAQSRAYTSKCLAQNQQSELTVRTPRFSRANPFDDISNLEFDKCSPGLFTVHHSSPEVPEFKWSIEEKSRIMPAQIDSPCAIGESCFDEETESAAQEAIDKYFSFHHAIISPPDAYVQAFSSPENSTPTSELLRIRAAMGVCWSGSKRMSSAISSTPCARTAAERRMVIKVDEYAQTQLSLPPTLPPELEEALRPYMLNKDDESEECNISSSTLRRKLFFNKEDELSPVKGGKNNTFPEVNTVDSPILNSNSRQSRTEWTPDNKNNECHRRELYCLSSPDISPIKCKSNSEYTNENMSIDCSSSSNAEKALLSEEAAKPLDCAKFSSPLVIKEASQYTRNIFSSTVRTSQIDRAEKDTGYSTMDTDSIASSVMPQTNKYLF